MITPDYCQMMARYNAWQNNGLRDMVAAVPDTELRRDRGAFFGSILATLNHILWADQMWMSRFEKADPPKRGRKDSVNATPDVTTWSAERALMDDRIARWADRVSAEVLSGTLSWYSGLKKSDVTMPMARCVAHVFNHQTHHRGQVHAMLTAAGLHPQDTDLFLMPEPV